VGYPTDAKWFEFLSDKWNDFSNFFVGGFFEAVYTTTEKSSSTTATYIQVDAKSIDYDTRFRAANTSTSNEKSALSSQKSNAFAQRRAKLSSSFLTTPKSVISRSNSVITYDAQDASDSEYTNQTPSQQLPEQTMEKEDDELKRFMNFYKHFKSKEPQESQQNSSLTQLSSVDSTNQTSITTPIRKTPCNDSEPTDEPELTPTPSYPARKSKRQLSDLCNDPEPTDEPEPTLTTTNPVRNTKRQLSDLCNDPESTNEPELIKETTRNSKRGGRGGRRGRGRGGRGGRKGKEIV